MCLEKCTRAMIVTLYFKHGVKLQFDNCLIFITENYYGKNGISYYVYG